MKIREAGKGGGGGGGSFDNFSWLVEAKSNIVGAIVIVKWF